MTASWMGQILTPAMYRRQFNRCTQSGVIFDDVIRLGLEEPGDVRLLSEDYTTIKIQLIRGSHRHSGNRNLTMNIRFWFIWKECQCWSVTAQSVTSVYEGHWLGPVSVGCVAGDAQSYILFCDFFDQVIEAYHKHKVTSQTPESDFNFDNLKGGDDLDRSYAVHCEVSAVRGVEDFCFPTHCSRGERRQLLTLARRALQWLEEEMPGRLLLLEELSQEQQRELNLDSPSPTQLCIGVARDWPDARAVWVSKNGSLVIWVNMDDHLKLVSTRNDANIAEAFKCICINLQKLENYYRELRHPFIWKLQLGWVTSSPAHVGTGLKVSVHLKLQHLPKHKRLQDVLKRLRIHMDSTESPALYHVSNATTFGLSEVGLTQLVVDGVKLLIAMEKRLEDGRDIDNLIPTQK